MRNYVIINGVNSLSIQGLAINNLPPITKPMIRTQREEIDGRDGDIVTELGYSAYDKSMEIGLYGNFDIDEIIKYFTGEGTIVFSNEEDKYYNFKILDQIDYEKLLKFKTATITFHCQPFKYPVEETPIEGEEITITGSGSNITLENTVVAPMEMKLKGNTIQDGTPTPTSPIPVQVVSGDNSINVVGNLNTEGIRLGLYQISNGEYASPTSGNRYATFNDLVAVQPNTTYTVTTSNNINAQFYQLQYGENKNYLSNSSSNQSVKSFTFTTGATTYYLAIDIRAYDSTNITTDYVGGIVLYNDSVSASYPISLSSKNLFDYRTVQNGDIRDANRTIRLCSRQNIWLEAGTYTFSTNMLSTYSYGLTTQTVGVPPLASYPTYVYDSGWKTTSSTTFTLTSAGYFVVQYKEANNGNISPMDLVNYHFQLEKGSSPTDYVPYSDTNIELCKIGTYQDKIFKNIPNTTDYDSNLEDNLWYLKKEIGKVVLNGSENWTNPASSGVYQYNASFLSIALSTAYCTHAKQKLINSNIVSTIGNNEFVLQTPSGYTYSILYFRDDTITGNVTNWKTWLSSNNVSVYYPLATPTYETITDTTLIGQLEALKPYSYNPVTNITQTNNDAPFELDVSLSYTNTMNVNNVGNIYAKPILTIEGSGTIGIILNDIEVLSVDLGTDEKITIDVPNLQAYNPDNDVLLNRNVTGDYMKLLINDGDNTIAFSGSVTSATLTNYTRWI